MAESILGSFPTISNSNELKISTIAEHLAPSFAYYTINISSLLYTAGIADFGKYCANHLMVYIVFEQLQLTSISIGASVSVQVTYNMGTYKISFYDASFQANAITIDLIPTYFDTLIFTRFDYLSCEINAPSGGNLSNPIFSIYAIG